YRSIWPQLCELETHRIAGGRAAGRSIVATRRARPARPYPALKGRAKVIPPLRGEDSKCPNSCRCYGATTQKVRYDYGATTQESKVRLRRSGKEHRSATDSLDNDAVSGASAKGFGVIHLLGFRWRHYKNTGSRRPCNVAVIVHAFPQQGSECLGSLVAQILMFVPGARPPPPSGSGRFLFGILRNRACCCELWIHRFEAGRYGIDKGDVVA